MCMFLYLLHTEYQKYSFLPERENIIEDILAGSHNSKRPV